MTEELKLATEGKIRTLLGSMNGVNSVEVMVTFESGVEYVYAQNESASGKTCVINGEEAVVVRAAEPRLRGIAVVCRADPAVRAEILKLLCSLFDLPSTRVYVTG